MVKSLFKVLLSVILFYGAQLQDTTPTSTTISAEVTAEISSTAALKYTLITVNSPDCEPSFVDNFPVRVQYRMISISDGGQNNTSVSEWMDSPNMPETATLPDSEANLTTLASNMSVHITVRSFSSMFSSDIDHVNSSQRVQFRLVQSDHRGGFCDCWAISYFEVKFLEPHFHEVPLDVNQTCNTSGAVFSNLTDFLGNFVITDNSVSFTNYTISADISLLGFCRGSASVPRGFVSVELGVETESRCDNDAAVVDTGRGTLLVGEQCDSMPYVRVNFDILFSIKNVLESFDEGVEFGFRNEKHGREWIPLAFYSFRTYPRNDDIILGSELTQHNRTRGTVNMRGYSVSYFLVGGTITHHAQLKLCGSEIIQNNASLSFRWLQTFVTNHATTADPVYLDNFMISINSPQHTLLKDDFNSGIIINSTRWTDVRDVLLQCQDEQECHIQFGGIKAPIFTPLPNAQTFISRGISTVPLHPNFLAQLSYTSTDATTPGLITTTIAAKTDLTSANTVAHTLDLTIANEDISASSQELNILSYIMETQIFSDIHNLSSNGSFMAVLMNLNNLLLSPTASRVSSEPVLDLTAAAYLLSTTVNGLGNQTVEPAISEIIMSTASRFLDSAQAGRTGREEIYPLELQYIAGSTLLQLMDEFALNNHNVSHPVTSNNIVFHTEELSLNETSVATLSPIQGEDAEIIIPVREVLASLESEAEVRMAAFLFRNMSGLMPESVEYNDGDSDDRVFRLASPVISASFKCDTCNTSNLSTPVQVTFNHTLYDEALLEKDSNGSVMCVFWQFNESDSNRAGAILYPGQWSEEGCQTNFNSTMTVCKCNHLTHFAILLSVRQLNIPRSQILTLQIFGYIGVSISLVAMAATILVLLFLEYKLNVIVSKKKPLCTLRNYVHIHLCVTLGIAQIIFVAGIEPHLGEGHLVGGVPVGCRLVAVLLHYWFLVSFMWMLMEGIVLYVALVRVFVTYNARYIAAFTISSYGLPLLYVGGLTVPLGFAGSEELRKKHDYDYGYEQACYLNPARSFIWSFIVPVILILLANMGFFIMTSIVKYRHQKSLGQYSKEKARHWLKTSISLTIVMGITWIIGVLVIEVEELFALAFIFTIFVAFQGLFIFFICVLLSTHVKESYAKWWTARVARKRLGEKSLPPTYTTHCSASSIPFAKYTTQETGVGTAEKFELSQNEVIKNPYVEEDIPGAREAFSE